MNLEQIDQTMTSLEMADYTGKQHKHVLESIRSMEPAWEKVNGSKFRLVEYMDKKGERRPMYELAKTECLYIATKFNDEARAILVLRWEELEREKKELSRKEILLLALKSEEERERLQVQNELQANELKAAAPKVKYCDEVIQANDAIRISVIANDLQMSAKRLNGILEAMKVQYKVNGTYILYSKYMGKGYTKTVTHPYTGSDGTIKTKILLCWTQKGRAFIMTTVPRFLEAIKVNPELN